jgi:hypothetical protein
MSPELREAIAKGVRKRYERLEASYSDDVVIEKKKCSKCGIWKDRAQDFSHRRKQLKSGLVKKYPAGECKDCRRIMRQEYEKRVGRKKVQEMRRKAQQKYFQNPEKQRMRRESDRFARAMRGINVQPIKKYRHELEEYMEFVDPEPFRQFLEEAGWPIFDGKSTISRYVRGFKEREYKQVHLEKIDLVATAMGRPEIVHILYG